MSLYHDAALSRAAEVMCELKSRLSHDFRTIFGGSGKLPLICNETHLSFSNVLGHVTESGMSRYPCTEYMQMS